MKRPTPQEVKLALRPLTKNSMGTNRLLEAVELRSGILVMEYLYVSKYHTERGQLYNRRIAVKTWFDRPPPVNLTVESGYLKES